MFVGALRSIIRPVSRTVLSSRSPFIFPITSSPSPACDRHYCHLLLSPFLGNVGGIPASNAFHSASLRPAAEEQLVLKQPNEGSARRRNEKNRIKQHPAIVLSEKEKRKEANRKKERLAQPRGKNWREKEKRKEEKLKEANRRKGLQLVGKNGREYARRIREFEEKIKKEFEEDKKKDAAVAAMSFTAWKQWQLIRNSN